MALASVRNPVVVFCYSGQAKDQGFRRKGGLRSSVVVIPQLLPLYWSDERGVRFSLRRCHLGGYSGFNTSRRRGIDSCLYSWHPARYTAFVCLAGCHSIQLFIHRCVVSRLGWYSCLPFTFLQRCFFSSDSFFKKATPSLFGAKDNCFFF